MSIAAMGTFTESGQAALEKYAAQYDNATAEQRKAYAGKYVTVDGVKLTRKQASDSLKLQRDGTYRPIYEKRTDANGVQTNTFKMRGHFMAVQRVGRQAGVNSSQANVGPKHNNRNSRSVISNDNAKRIQRNQQTIKSNISNGRLNNTGRRAVREANDEKIGQNRRIIANPMSRSTSRLGRSKNNSRQGRRRNKRTGGALNKGRGRKKGRKS